MAVIYLRHDTFGAKVACSEQEAVYDESHGWVRYTPEAPADAAPADQELPNFLVSTRRRGRPPKSVEGQPWLQPEN